MSAELAGITGPVTALVAGLVTSIHCAAMCGPLACSVMPNRRNGADPQVIATTYHLARLAGYAALGALAGAVGRAPLHLIGETGLRYAPWLLVAFFVTLAFRLDRWIPRPRIIGRLLASGWFRGAGSPVRAAATLGIATPLLPCGPLYFLISLAMLSGSAARGAENLLAFGLGTVPLLWLAQAGFQRLQVRLGPVAVGRLQRTLALTVAVVIAWRLRTTLGLGGPGATDYVCF